LKRFKPYLKYLLLLLIVSDVGYSFVQHLNMPIDGDFSKIVLPADEYKKVLTDPLGFHVIFKDEIYAAPNRFFIHWIMSGYFKFAPRFLQNFVSPVDSIYLSIAISKILIQLLLIWVLASFINRKRKNRTFNFLLAMILVIPFFQTSGYYQNLGIIDQSVTYCFFYAFPMGLLGLFLYPFFRSELWKWNPFLHIIWIMLAIVLPISGPIIPAVIIIICFLSVIKQTFTFWSKIFSLPIFEKIKKIYSSFPKAQVFYFSVVSLMCLYSLFIGRNNSENFNQTQSLIDSYSSLPDGLFHLLSQKPGLPLLVLAIIVNSIFLYRKREGEQFMTILKWFGLFVLLYILLMPLGGYRDYRPLIIRRDVFIPVIVGLIYLFGYSTVLVGNILKDRFRQFYTVGVILLLFNFTIIDLPEWNKNDCEKEALNAIANSEEEVISLKQDCTIMHWNVMKHPNQSKINAELLYFWGVTESVQLYYQE
jgi:hypothetical protein